LKGLTLGFSLELVLLASTNTSLARTSYMVMQFHPITVIEYMPVIPDVRKKKKL
jgi:hypothetical protein